MSKEKQVWLVREDYDEFITIEGIFSTKKMADKFVEKIGFGFVECWPVDTLNDFVKDNRRIYSVSYNKYKHKKTKTSWRVNVSPEIYDNALRQTVIDCRYGDYMAFVFAESEEEATEAAMKRFEEYFKHDD